jgi:hypothetical protein
MNKINESFLEGTDELSEKSLKELKKFIKLLQLHDKLKRMNEKAQAEIDTTRSNSERKPLKILRFIKGLFKPYKKREHNAKICTLVQMFATKQGGQVREKFDKNK